MTINGNTTDITTICTYPVTGDKLNELTIPSSITDIIGSAFYGVEFNRVYFNATNCTGNGFVTDTSHYQVFDKVKIIDIGVGVEALPDFLFYNVTPENLIINSPSTQMGEYSFYCVSENRDLGRLTFNFVEPIDSEYLHTLFLNSGLYSFKLHNIYSKAKLSEDLIKKSFSLNYVGTDGDYFVYSDTSFTITASSNRLGKVSPAGTTYYASGSSATFTFTPNEGCHLNSVLIDGTPLSPEALLDAIENGYTFENITENHIIQATFAINTYTISATASEGGTISPVGDTTVNYGERVAYTISPNEGYIIKDVLIDGVSVGAVGSYTFTSVKTNHTIAVEFDVATFSINASAGANGTISPVGDTIVNYGDNITYIFTPSEGYTITDVLVDGVSVGAVGSYTFTNVKTNHSIAVEFGVATFSINASAGENGTISPNGKLAVERGDSALYTFTPNEGYKVTDVKPIRIRST